MLAHAGMDAGTRNAIQDVVWTAGPHLEIPKRTRREIARDLDLDEFLPAHGSSEPCSVVCGTCFADQIRANTMRQESRFLAE